MFQQINRPLGLGAILLQSLKLFSKGFLKAAPFTIFAAVISAEYLSKRVNDHNFIFNTMSLFQIHWPAVIMHFVVSLLVCWCYSAVYYQYQNVMLGRPSHFSAASIHGLKHFIFLFITMFFYFIMTSLGFVVFVVPGIIIGVAFILATAIIATDTINPYRAFKESYQLVMPHWWRVFMLPVLPFIILLLIGFIANEIAKELFIHGLNDLGSILLIRSICSAILGVFFTNWYFSLMLLVWNDLKIRAAQAPKPAEEKPADDTMIDFLEKNTQ